MPLEVGWHDIATSSITMGENAALVEMSCEITWRARHDESEQPLDFLKEIATRYSLARIDWRAGDKALE